MPTQKNVLMLRCSNCSETFRSPIGGHIKALKEAALINNTIQCPNCGFKMLTSKPDFFYIDDDGQEQSISFKGGYYG